MWKIVNVVRAAVIRAGDAGELGLIRGRKECCRMTAIPRSLIPMPDAPGSSLQIVVLFERTIEHTAAGSLSQSILSSTSQLRRTR